MHFYSAIKIRKTNISRLLTLDLKISQPKHGFRFILATLYNSKVQYRSKHKHAVWYDAETPNPVHIFRTQSTKIYFNTKLSYSCGPSQRPFPVKTLHGFTALTTGATHTRNRIALNLSTVSPKRNLCIYWVPRLTLFVILHLVHLVSDTVYRG
jgi:hypothetical protein